MIARLPKRKVCRRCRSLLLGFSLALALPGAAAAMDLPSGGSGPAAKVDGTPSLRQKRDWLHFIPVVGSVALLLYEAGQWCEAEANSQELDRIIADHLQEMVGSGIGPD